MLLTWTSIQAGSNRAILLLACAILCGYVYQVKNYRAICIFAITRKISDWNTSLYHYHLSAPTLLTVLINHFALATDRLTLAKAVLGVQNSNCFNLPIWLFNGWIKELNNPLNFSILLLLRVSLVVCHNIPLYTKLPFLSFFFLTCYNVVAVSTVSIKLPRTRRAFVLRCIWSIRYFSILLATGQQKVA